MPKMKSHSGIKKRVRVTGSGKLMRQRAGKRHLNEHKSTRETRRLGPDAELTGTDAKKVRRLLGK